MENENIDVSVYDTVERIFDDVLKSDFKDKDKVYEYLSLLQAIEQEQTKLDSNLKNIAMFNEVATAYVVYVELDKAFKENIDYAMEIINKEIIRLRGVISEYKTGNIKSLSYEDMESILRKYATDDKVLFDVLSVLYDAEIVDDPVIKKLVYI